LITEAAQYLQKVFIKFRIKDGAAVVAPVNKLAFFLVKGKVVPVPN
jgi:hypothetical protein